MKLSSHNLSKGAAYKGHDSEIRVINRIENGRLWYDDKCIPVWQFIVWAKEQLTPGERTNGSEEISSCDTGSRILHDLQPRDSRSRQQGRDTRKDRKTFGRKKKWSPDD